MKETYTGLVEAFGCQEFINCNDGVDSFYATYTDAVFATCYDGIASRLTIRVNMSSYSGTACIGMCDLQCKVDYPGHGESHAIASWSSL